MKRDVLFRISFERPDGETEVIYTRAAALVFMPEQKELDEAGVEVTNGHVGIGSMVTGNASDILKLVDGEGWNKIGEAINGDLQRRMLESIMSNFLNKAEG